MILKVTLANGSVYTIRDVVNCQVTDDSPPLLHHEKPSEIALVPMRISFPVPSETPFLVEPKRLDSSMFTTPYKHPLKERLRDHILNSIRTASCNPDRYGDNFQITILPPAYPKGILIHEVCKTNPIQPIDTVEFGLLLAQLLASSPTNWDTILSWIDNPAFSLLIQWKHYSYMRVGGARRKDQSNFHNGTGYTAKNQLPDNTGIIIKNH